MSKTRSIILNSEDMISLFSKYYTVDVKRLNEEIVIGLVDIPLDEEQIPPEIREILSEENTIYIRKKKTKNIFQESPNFSERC